MTIIVVWQLRVTLDSIRNSCDVCFLVTVFVLTHFVFMYKFWIWICANHFLNGAHWLNLTNYSERFSNVGFHRAGIVVPMCPQYVPMFGKCPESSAMFTILGSWRVPTPPFAATGEILPRVVPLPDASLFGETNVDANDVRCVFPALAGHCSNQDVLFRLEHLIFEHYGFIFSNENTRLPSISIFCNSLLNLSRPGIHLSGDNRREPDPRRWNLKHKVLHFGNSVIWHLVP